MAVGGLSNQDKLFCMNPYYTDTYADENKDNISIAETHSAALGLLADQTVPTGQKRTNLKS